MNAPFALPAMKWKRHIERALHRCNTESTFDDVHGRLISNDLLFTENETAFAIVELLYIDKNLRIHIFLMGGDRAGMLALEKIICDYAREAKATRVTAITRKGFAGSRWWRENTQGWKTPSDFIEKEI